MKRILIPTDYSELSHFALDVAKRIGKQIDAEIYALKIVLAPPEAVFDAQGNLKQNDAIDVSVLEKRKADDEKKMTEWLKEVQGISTYGEVRFGHVAADVTRYIEEKEIDLVLMSTHGVSGLKEWFLESNAEQIVRTSPAPVLTLKCDRSSIELNHILLASDFSKPELNDISVIRGLQKAYDATLHLLHVNTPKDFCSQREVAKQMKSFIAHQALENTEFHVYCDKSVEQGIGNFAADNNMDLVAIGTHGRTGLSRFFHPSISEALVNHVYQPILTFKIK